ncbi:MAG: ABC transporter permease [Verrucomicrobiales bacterium]
MIANAARSSLFVAWRYLRHHRLRSAILVLALGIVLFVPAALEILVRESSRQLTARAEATPLLLGSPGSSLDLAMSALYFAGKQPGVITMGDARAIDESDLARAIPLHTAFSSGGFRIVGTTLDYFSLRGLEIADGRQMGMLGEAVLGAAAARELGVGPGDSLVSSPENFVDIAGTYPLKMRIAGVLAPTGSPDDEAVFVDLRTSWVIAGLGHGHQDLALAEDASIILKSGEGGVTANANLVTYAEITPENIGEFHFHGDDAGFPVSAAIIVPRDEKSRTLLLGRYQADNEHRQLIRPDLVIGELVDAIFRIRKLLNAIVAVVALATLLSVFLVFMLSLRLRADELETLFRLGGSRGAAAAFVVAELTLVGLASLLVAAALGVAVRLWQDQLLALLLSGV